MAERRRSPFIWVTWVTGLLAGDDSCRWAAWFKAHHTYDKVERDSGKLAQWKSDHGVMVQLQADFLRERGWTVYLENQNKFYLDGRAAKLSGTPDIVATKDLDALVVDCKSGKRRDKDVWQVMVYMLALPRTHEACKGRVLRGQVVYVDHVIDIPPQQFTEAYQSRIVRQLQESGGDTAPERVPSARECRFCDIPTHDCSARVESDTEEAVAAHDLF